MTNLDKYNDLDEFFQAIEKGEEKYTQSYIDFSSKTDEELKKIIMNVHLVDKYEADLYIAEMTKRNLTEFIK